MIESEYIAEIESLKGSYERAKRCIADWERYKNGLKNIRPRTSIAYHFRPGALLVTDTLRLLGLIYKDRDQINTRKSGVNGVVALIKDVLGCLKTFAEVPSAQSNMTVAEAKKLFEQTYQSLTEAKDESVGEVSLVIPTCGKDKAVYREDVKKLAHNLAQVLMESSKLHDVTNYRQARDYIIGCVRGRAYHKYCKVIQDAMESFGWSTTSLLTFCKGGSIYDQKTNDERQAKISKKKRLVTRDLVGAWHDAVP